MLNLTPESAEAADPAGMQTSSKPNPFGGAKPLEKRPVSAAADRPAAAARPNPIGDAKPVAKNSGSAEPTHCGHPPDTLPAQIVCSSPVFLTSILDAMPSQDLAVASIVSHHWRQVCAEIARQRLREMDGPANLVEGIVVSAVAAASVVSSARSGSVASPAPTAAGGRPTKPRRGHLARLRLAEALGESLAQACDAVRRSSFYGSSGGRVWDPTQLQRQLWREALSGRDVLCVGGNVCEAWVALSAAALAHVRTSPPLRPTEGPIVLFVTPTREQVRMIPLRQCITVLLDRCLAVVYYVDNG